MLQNTYNKYKAYADHKILWTSFFCQPHISIFLGNLFGNLKLLFVPKYIAIAYCTLKFFLIFDKTVIDRK